MCINQDGIRERNRHVAHMRSSYGAAQDTNYHLLGRVKPSDRSKNILQAVKISIDQISVVQCGSTKVTWEDFCRIMIAASDSYSEYFGAGYDNEPKRRFKDIYWERRTYRQSQGMEEEQILLDSSFSHAGEKRMRLLDLLKTKRGCGASDSRDTIYALFCIVDIGNCTQQILNGLQKACGIDISGYCQLPSRA